MLLVFVALPLTVKLPYQGESSTVPPTNPKNIGKKNITPYRVTERAETVPLFAIGGRGESD
jgi:hypothetical protein